MFEVRLMRNGDTLYLLTCEKGDILPTIATLMQKFEAERGSYRYQTNYAIQWRQVRE